jgi:hypothetical protein
MENIRKPSWVKKWFENRITLIIIIVTSLMFIIATIGVIYAITHKSEEGIVEICWVNSRAIYYPRNNCNKEKLIWSKERIPLKVFVLSLSEQFDNRSNDICKNSINEINSQLGFVLFSLIPDDEDYDVIIYWGNPLVPDGIASNSPGMYNHMKIDNRIKAELFVKSNSVDDFLTYRLVTQLLLFSAGLTEDYFKSSVMYSPISSTSSVMITDFDKSELRRLYKNGEI